MYSFDSNKYSSLISSKQQKSAAQSYNTINDVVDGELASSYNELNDARQRLRLLEMKIQTLENRIAKKYPDVLFLNYKNRKRILVWLFLYTFFFSLLLQNVLFAIKKIDNGWSWVRWFTSGRLLDDARS